MDGFKYQRKDGLWNIMCSCGATVAGVNDRQIDECWNMHLENARRERNLYGKKYPPCGMPKQEDIDVALDYMEWFNSQINM